MHRLPRQIWLACFLILGSVSLVFSQRNNNVTVNVYASATPSPTPKPTPKSTPPPDPTMAAQKIKLYYQRDATKIAALVNAIAEPETSTLHGLLARTATEDEVILYGSREQRELDGGLSQRSIFRDPEWSWTCGAYRSPATKLNRWLE